MAVREGETQDGAGEENEKVTDEYNGASSREGFDETHGNIARS
jgi:hypothetical protein